MGICTPDKEQVKEHDLVELLEKIVDDEGVFEKGTVGTVISIYRNGIAFAIEADSKVFNVRSSQVVKKEKQ
jgi:hypothetical protein